MNFNKALDNLDSSLNQCVTAEHHLNKAALNGFFHALVITPCIIDPSEWMAELFHGQRPNLNNVQAKNLKKAVIATIKSSNRLLTTDQLRFPYNFSELTSDTCTDIWQWYYGFLRGINLRMAFWQSGIIASETGQTHDVVKASINIMTAFVTEDVGFLDNLDMLKSQLGAKNLASPSDEQILAEIFTILPDAYECLRIFAAKMSQRLQVYQAEMARTAS